MECILIQENLEWYIKVLSSDNIFSESLPAISCSLLPSIDDGRVIVTSTVVGSTARYICNTGFELDGDASRTCQPNGEWSGQEPICKRKFK